MTQRKQPEDLRSHRWFGTNNLRAFGHRSRAKQMGYSPDDFAGKPVVAIINTWSDLNPCHSHFRTRADEVKRGVWQAGGFPVELPAMSVTETYMKPSPMM
ncbi:MAG: dihydroxy-acid dehydratase, partial [Pyrinomonadaceae bacterium]